MIGDVVVYELDEHRDVLLVAGRCQHLMPTRKRKTWPAISLMTFEMFNYGFDSGPVYWIGNYFDE